MWRSREFCDSVGQHEPLFSPKERFQLISTCGKKFHETLEGAIHILWKSVVCLIIARAKLRAQYDRTSLFGNFAESNGPFKAQLENLGAIMFAERNTRKSRFDSLLPLQHTHLTHTSTPADIMTSC